VPEVEALEGSGCCGLVGAGFDCFGLTPEVEGVGEECGVLEVVKVLEPVLGGEAGARGGAGDTTGGAVFVGLGAALIVGGPKG